MKCKIHDIDVIRAYNSLKGAYSYVCPTCERDTFARSEQFGEILEE